MKFSRIAFVVAPTVLALAACGGGAGAPTGPLGATSGAGSSAAAPSGPPAATVATQPSSAPTTAQPSSAGALDLCSLLEANDLHTVLGGSWLEGQLTSTGGYCHWDNANQPNEQTITAIDARALDAIKSAAPDGTDMTVAGHAGYSTRQAGPHLQTTYVDLGGQVLVLEFGTSSSAGDDQEHAQQLAEIAIGNL